MDSQVLIERIQDIKKFMDERAYYPSNTAENLNEIIDRLRKIAMIQNSNEQSLMIGELIQHILDVKEKQHTYSSWMKQTSSLCFALISDIKKITESGITATVI